jgi:hypothetical protein
MSEAGGLRPEDTARMAGAAPHVGALRPEFVTPLVAFLASEACGVTQQAFSAAFGRFARVFVGVAPGWYGPREAPASAEVVRDHRTEIQDRAGYLVPRSVFDEGGLVLERLDASWAARSG